MKKRIIHTLSFRVLAGSLALLIVLFGIYSYLTVRFNTEQMMAHQLESANRLSDVIKQSTHYGMLLNRREDVYQIITTIGEEPGVEGIRIYNKRGEIMFSTAQEENNSTVNMDAEACYGCHDHEKPLESISMDNRMRIYNSPKGYRVLGLINPIHNEPTCSQAECHAHPAEKTVLGVLDVRMSLAQTDVDIAGTQRTMMTYAVVGIALVAGVSLFFLFFTVVRPVNRLVEGVKQISSGNLLYRIPSHTKDELGKLAEEFNVMTASLEQEKHINQQWQNTLEQRIEEKTGELNAFHGRMMQIEKMASLGKLSATVAHEINNPLEGILTYAKLIARRIMRMETKDEMLMQTLEDIELIARETNRCGLIVKNLLLFSKKQVSEFALVRVKGIIEKSVKLVEHHFLMQNVECVVTMGDEDSTIMCDENQIEQALVALFVNAVEAMPGGGAAYGYSGCYRHE